MKRSQGLCKDTQGHLNKTKEKKGKVLPFLICCLGIFLVLVSGVLNGATYTVIRTAPDDNNPGSLRWAMNSANLITPGMPDTIDFNIPGAGPHTIFPDSQLPVLWDPTGVFIDGLTQAGSSAGSNPPSTANLMVIINGINAGASHGFWIVTPFNTIQGLVINNFEQDGIRIQGVDAGTFNNYIYCNFVGTDQTGTVDQGNGTNTAMFWAGVYIIVTPEYVGFAYDNLVERNLILGNYAEGVGIASCPPGDVYMNVVLLNYIGTDITGTVDLGNDHCGVYIGEGAHDNAVDSNLICGNDYEGVCVVGYAEAGIYTNGNIIIYNNIGLDINLAPLGNTMDGVSIGQYGNLYQGGYAEYNMIDSNTIAYNGNNGVTIWEHSNNTTNADYNTITRNSIYDNVWLGIDLGDDGVTPNDPGDPDPGANQELNFPVITGAHYYSGPTLITGTIDVDTDPTQATIEVFWARPDPSGYGEGALYLGSTTPDAAGNWNITVTGLVIGDTVTATTTDMNMNTSEFSQNNSVILGIEEGGSSGNPAGYILNQNTPNPFSNLTTIVFALPKTGHVSLKIYDVSGKLVKTLADGLYSPSDYTAYWNGRDENGCKVCSGVYFYILETEDFSATKKLILTK
ncbi:T9SS type A sorting domain-containing protein [candidate division WOR-3 bacterium]|nr:T9SS type A sorting domain-containing protein [candidate division WOR-3 bacterium]